MELSLGGEDEFPSSTSGLFVVNSGNYMSETASLSYYDFFTEDVYNDVIRDANNVYPIGDVGQSMVIRGDLGYIVLNNSGKILIIDVNTSKLKGKITGLTSPRYMHFVSDTKAYISDLYGQTITVVDPSIMDPTQNQIINRIDVSNGNANFYQHSTETMVQAGRYLFVACWMYDDQVLVVDTESDELVDSIQVGVQPNSLVIDKYNKLWVLCDGGYEGSAYAHATPQLYRINVQDLQIEDSISFSMDDSPSSLITNFAKDSLFFINTDVYAHSVLSGDIPEVIIHSDTEHTGFGKGFYTLGINPYNSDIYVADAIDNAQSGIVYRFNSDGVPVDTFKVGINPTHFCFK